MPFVPSCAWRGVERTAPHPSRVRVHSTRAATSHSERQPTQHQPTTHPLHPQLALTPMRPHCCLLWVPSSLPPLVYRLLSPAEAKTVKVALAMFMKSKVRASVDCGGAGRVWGAVGSSRRDCCPTSYADYSAALSSLDVPAGPERPGGHATQTPRHPGEGCAIRHHRALHPQCVYPSITSSPTPPPAVLLSWGCPAFVILRLLDPFHFRVVCATCAPCPLSIL